MRVVTTSVGPDSDWSEVVSELNAFDGLANGVTLIVAPGCPVEVCHELALALASDALCQRGLRRLVAYSVRSNLRGNFLSFSGGDGFLNRWMAIKDDFKQTKSRRNEPMERHYGVAEPLLVDDLEKRLRRDLWPFGPRMILADVECWQLPMLEGLGERARKRGRKMLVATSLPMPPSDGPATREAVELALMSATGMSVDLLAKQILSISAPRQEGRNLKYEVGVIRI